MQRLKIADVLVQAGLFLVSGIAFLCGYISMAFDTFYYTLGGYQLATHYVKYLAGIRTPERRFYNLCLKIIYTCAIIIYVLARVEITNRNGFVKLAVVYMAMALLVIAPAMAVFQLILSYREMKDSLVIPSENTKYN